MINISKDNIYKYYQRLRHSEFGCTELRVLIPGEKYTQGIGYFDNADDFVAACVKKNGQANIYAGRNPRPIRFMRKARNEIKQLRTGTRKEDIEIVTAVAIDIDPKRLDPKQPSTKGELDAALKVAHRLSGGIENASIDCTGNGACIWLPIEPMAVEESLEDKLKELERHFRYALTEEEQRLVTVDSIYDLPRINKVIGTLSVKGNNTVERPHRLTYFAAGPFFDIVEGLSDKILKLRKPGKKKPRPKRRQVSEQVTTVGSTLPKEQIAQIVDAMPPVVNRLWENGYTEDRSAGLTTLLQYFLSQGIGKHQAVALVMVADSRWGKYTAQGRRGEGFQYMFNAAEDIISWANAHDYGVVKLPYHQLGQMFLKL